MRSQSCLLLPAVALLAGLGTNCVSAFSFDKKNSGLQIPNTGASPDLATAAASLSQKSVTKASNNQFMSYPTRRETIKMPSQTPMVPWTVRCVSSSGVASFRVQLKGMNSIQFNSIEIKSLFVFTY